MQKIIALYLLVALNAAGMETLGGCDHCFDDIPEPAGGYVPAPPLMACIPPTKETMKTARSDKHAKLLATAHELINTKKDLNAPNNTFTNQILLHETAQHDSFLDVTQLLLDHGANPNCTRKRLDTEEKPLNEAARNVAPKTVKELLARGAYPKDIRLLHNICSFTLDSWSTKRREKQLLITQILLNAGVDPNEQNEDGQTPLFYLLCKFQGLDDLDAQEHPLFLEHRQKLISLLLAKGIETNNKDKENRTAIEWINCREDLKEQELVNFLDQKIKEKTIK